MKYNNEDMRKAISNIFGRLDVRNDGLVVVRFSGRLPKIYAKSFLDEVERFLPKGTLCVVDDCGFNTSDTRMDVLSNLANKERLVLASGGLLQLLALKDTCLFAMHPSLMIGCYGTHSSYLARHSSLDFPYGGESIFRDFVEMKATYLVVSADNFLYELKHVFAYLDNSVVVKNTCVLDGKLLSYLDYDCDFEWINNKVYNSRLLVEEKIDDVSIFGTNYSDLIEYLKTAH